MTNVKIQSSNQCQMTKYQINIFVILILAFIWHLSFDI